MINKLFVLIIALSITGCAATGNENNLSADEKYILDTLDKTLSTLANKAFEAKRITMTHQAAMTRLAIKNSDSSLSQYRVPHNMDIPYPLSRAFYGDAIQPLKQIADYTNYHFKIKGAGPETEVLWVKLHDKMTRSAFEIIQDIADQIDKRGFDVHIWSDSKGGKNGVILLEYRGS